jgi:hypothetical protein
MVRLEEDLKTVPVDMAREFPGQHRQALTNVRSVIPSDGHWRQAPAGQNLAFNVANCLTQSRPSAGSLADVANSDSFAEHCQGVDWDCFSIGVAKSSRSKQ